MSCPLYSLTVGDGSDDFLFTISISSKAVLSVLLHANESLIPGVFHMDSTFKCNENEFPITLLGISDASRQFHLLSISVLSSCLHLLDPISSRISSKGVTRHYISVQILHD
jgi:hypothetical protein